MKTLSLTPLADRIATWLAIIALAFAVCCSPAFAQSIDQSDTCEVKVVRVVDGDTFYCVSTTRAGEADTVKIRVLNLDTFEKMRGERLDKQAERMGITPDRALLLGKVAREYATDLLQGATVTLHRGDRRAPNHDKYGRLLRYVILSDGRDFSDVMKSQGYNVKR